MNTLNAQQDIRDNKLFMFFMELLFGVGHIAIKAVFYLPIMFFWGIVILGMNDTATLNEAFSHSTLGGIISSPLMYFSFAGSLFIALMSYTLHNSDPIYNRYLYKIDTSQDTKKKN